MTWVLILWITYGGGGAGIDHIEFRDKEQCEAALAVVLDTATWGTGMRGVCVERNQPKVFGP